MPPGTPAFSHEPVGGSRDESIIAPKAHEVQSKNAVMTLCIGLEMLRRAAIRNFVGIA